MAFALFSFFDDTHLLLFFLFFFFFFLSFLSCSPYPSVQGYRLILRLYTKP
jgi:hypothetical protein